MKVHFSSQRFDWKTPKSVYQILDAEFQFDHDPCPPQYKIDGLESEWGKSNFVNPPYGRELPKWIEKGYAEWQKGKTVVFLIPSRTDTRWFHNYIWDEKFGFRVPVRFPKKRYSFGEYSNTSKFAILIAIFL